MMSSSEANRLMAKGLSYQATGETKKIELNRQLVAINNFLWRTDQLIWRREHTSASKMLQKAFGVAGRMEEQPQDILRELRIRKQLLEERERIVPYLRIGECSPNDIHIEFFDSANGPQNESTGNVPWPTNRSFSEEMEALVFVRNEVFINELGCNPQLENDERDEISRHSVLYMGDAIIGGARIWIQHPATTSGNTAPSVSSFAPVAVAVLDRLFIIPEYRGRGLAKRLLAAVNADARRLGLPLFITVRNESPPVASQQQQQFADTTERRLRELVKSKLSNSKGFKVLLQDAWLPHQGISGGLGIGISATVFEPCFAGM